jgi:hypothetical protein
MMRLKYRESWITLSYPFLFKGMLRISKVYMLAQQSVI